ncbi:DUF2061 domain-containing protein [Neisseria perflava]|uniref:DUF2061 domain-containing protein n=1 Tax=Neisseria perflava TaxID=33053 RepID=UPI0020A0E6C9|nr:DUF2061 domain-containing protein [Neisseria perflava]MCP1660081.1 putative membrane protein [Neisseria perflava]MCP1773008.1 putative membrane protein [Neisseria perflava]
MLKTLTFAILHFSVAFGVTYTLTGSFGVSGAVALIEPLVNTVVFYFHEKAWARHERHRANKQADKVAAPLHTDSKCGTLGAVDTSSAKQIFV